MRKIVAVLGIAGLVLMACGGGGAGNPEDAVSGFFDAIKSGDVDAASSYIQGGIPEDERGMIEEVGPMFEMMELEVTGSEISEDGNTAVVFISISFMGESDEDEIEVVLVDGSWKLAEFDM